MIGIHAVNAELADQDADRRATFAKIVRQTDLNPAVSALVGVVSEGLAAVHERKESVIAIMLQTGG